MFHQFGERIAPFIPCLYEVDFAQLPLGSDALFGLAAIYAIARYLPDSLRLRSSLCVLLRRRLRDVIFETPSHSSSQCPDGLSTGTMQGLVVLYSCCEATAPHSPTHSEDEPPDILTVRSIAEGYALKMRIGGLYKLGTPHCLLPYIWLLWLYTMSHQ
jgi:hypothetical protein